MRCGYAEMRSDIALLVAADARVDGLCCAMACSAVGVAGVIVRACQRDMPHCCRGKRLESASTYESDSAM